jgi:hypothetical protein
MTDAVADPNVGYRASMTSVRMISASPTGLIARLAES